MEFGWSRDELAYRDEVQRFVAEALPADWEALSQGGPGSDAQAAFSREFCARLAEAEVHGLRILDAMLRGQPGVVEVAANKVVHTEVCQEIARAGFDLTGAEALADDCRLSTLSRQSLWETIGGGTSEIMRSVIATQALGLSGRS